MTSISASAIPRPARGLILAASLNAVWINTSEVFRYFVFVMPMMRAALPGIQNVAPMSLPVFLVWAVWDTIVQTALTGFVWLYLEKFGYGIRNALIAGAMCWLAIFGVLWLALLNMNLATPRILAVALPMALLELLVGALILNWAVSRPGAAPRT
jgi:hypothetical protein